MSDESPIHRHQLPGSSRSSRRIRTPGTRLLRRVGVEQVDQRRTDPPEAVPRHEAAPVRMLFSRKWLSALKNTLLVDCIRILQAWGAYDRIEHNKNESFMLFGRIGSTSSPR